MAQKGLTMQTTERDTPSSGVPLSLRPEQQARRIDPTAYALHIILQEARAGREEASLALAVSTATWCEEALRLDVAASGAVDVALQALTSYIAHGFYQPRESAEPETDPLHERCRLARDAVAKKIAAALPRAWSNCCAAPEAS